eukprot:8271961-Karenia_brevis.AAC.1
MQAGDNNSKAPNIKSEALAAGQRIARGTLQVKPHRVSERHAVCNVSTSSWQQDPKGCWLRPKAQDS